jgi:hypothetical protein
MEFQRDWAIRDHLNDKVVLLCEHGATYGADIDNCGTMVHKAPAARKLAS